MVEDTRLRTDCDPENSWDGGGELVRTDEADEESKEIGGDDVELVVVVVVVSNDCGEGDIRLADEAERWEEA